MLHCGWRSISVAQYELTPSDVLGMIDSLIIQRDVGSKEVPETPLIGTPPPFSEHREDFFCFNQYSSRPSSRS